MADSKISALPASTTPLTGAEVLPVVQSGTTKKVSVANLTAGRVVSVSELQSDDGANGRWTLQQGASYNIMFSTTTGFGGWRSAQLQANGTAANMTWGTDGNTTFSVGNLIQGTAAKGVNFTANTPAAGMTSQLLNWYEEGTFTPTVVGSTSAGTATYSTQEGVYTRIGRCVYYSIALSWSAGNGTGDLRIAGLPFTSRSQTNYMMGAAQPGSLLAITANNFVAPQVIVNDTQIRVIEVPIGGGSVGVLAYDGEAALNLTGFYFV